MNTHTCITHTPAVTENVSTPPQKPPLGACSVLAALPLEANTVEFYSRASYEWAHARIYPSLSVFELLPMQFEGIRSLFLFISE